MFRSPRVAIVGGGISGLAAAFHLQQTDRDLDVTLLEASSRLGGVLQTEIVDSFLIEHSADMFTVDPPDAIQLCEALGIADQLLTTRPTPDRAFVVTGEGIAPVPRGFSLMLPGDVDAVLESPILSEAGKKRFLGESEVPPKMDDRDESLESFAVRRFGQEVFERLIQPLASGIYTADPATLSMRATMARFVRLEQEHGSLIAAGRNQALRQANLDGDGQTSGARYGLFRAPQQGLGQLVNRIQQSMPKITLRCNTAVQTIERQKERWVVQSKPPGSTGNLHSDVYDAVIVTTPASITGSLLGSLDPNWIPLLSSITSASSAIVILAMDSLPDSPTFDGYGIIVPSILNRPAIACSFASNKFAHRAGPNQNLIRCFFGGALNPQVLLKSDSELVQLALAEVRQLVGLTGFPRDWRVIRWNECMPQYTLGHLDRIAKIEAIVDQNPGLQLAGNSYHGVGIPACIAAGTKAARQTVTLFDG